MRSKSVLIMTVTLCTGILIGVAVANLPIFMGSTVNSYRVPLPLPAIGPSLSAPSANLHASPSSAEDDTITELARKIALLSVKLNAEASSRKQLEDKLSELKANLRFLEQRLDEFSEWKSKSDAPSPQIGRSQQISSATFVEAGFSQDEAETLSTLWGQQQMDLLYLRDQASREGWLGSSRYAEARRELRTGEGSMQAELSLESYDRFLFATGQSNRVVLNSVIESSPAQDIGLQPGDTILTYDGNRILSATDLQTATRTGEPDVPVLIVVERGGQIMEFEITRGPIGVTLGTSRVKP